MITTILVFTAIWYIVGLFCTLLGNKIFDDKTEVTIGDLLCALTGVGMVIIFLAALFLKLTESNKFDVDHVIFDFGKIFKKRE